MFTLVAAIVLSFVPDSPPQKPLERDWPGGAWTGEDSDKGKEFPAGSFKYVPRKEQEAYQKALRTWLLSHPDEQKKLAETQGKIRYELFGVAQALPTLRPKMDADSAKLVASGPISAYGGSGTISVEYGYPGTRKITVLLREVDIATTLDAIGLVPPIRVTGTTGKLEGTVTNDHGYFVGTENRSGGLISRIELTVDFSRGTWTSVADTSYGRRTFAGKLKTVKLITDQGVR